MKKRKLWRAATVMVVIFPVPSAARSDSLGSAIAAAVRQCEASDAAEEEIRICGLREAERSAYRLPEPERRFDPAGDLRSLSAERNALLDITRRGGGLYNGGSAASALGAHPCSSVGAQGHSGCFAARHRDYGEQHNE